MVMKQSAEPRLFQKCDRYIIFLSLLCVLSLPAFGAGVLRARIDDKLTALSLTSHDVQVTIQDQVAKTVIDETFHNHTEETLEGTLYFPMPADASISGFTLWIDGFPVEADVVEKARAREIFETIVWGERDPALLEWTGGNVFKARIYPIFGGKKRRIRITYIQVLDKRGGVSTYVYPVEEGQFGSQHVRRFSFHARVSSTLPMAEIACPGHDLLVEKSGRQASIRYPAGKTPPDRDLQIRIIASRPEEGGYGITHVHENQGYFMTLVDPLAPMPPVDATAPGPLDLVFMVDTSASVSPARAGQARSVLSSFLSQCSERDRFNVLAFDATRAWAFPESVPATKAWKDKALTFLEARGALGWTDIPGAFKTAAERIGQGTQVIFLGDGIATARAVVSAKAADAIRAAWRGKGSVHAIAIGASFDEIVLNAMASLGNGSFHPMASGTDPAAVVASIRGAITFPGVRDVRLSWNGVHVMDVHPSTLSMLPAGRQLRIVGRYKPSSDTQHGTLSITGKVNGRPITRRIPLVFPEKSTGNDYLPSVWAKAHLDHLLRQEDREAVRERIVALSQEHHVITPYTSFLVLESALDRRRFAVKRSLRPKRVSGHEALVRSLKDEAKKWRDDLREKILRLYGRLEDIVDFYAMANAVDRQTCTAIGGLGGDIFVVDSGHRLDSYPVPFTTSTTEAPVFLTPLLGRYTVMPWFDDTYYDSFGHPHFHAKEKRDRAKRAAQALFDDPLMKRIDSAAPSAPPEGNEDKAFEDEKDHPPPPLSVRLGPDVDSRRSRYVQLSRTAPFFKPTPLDIVFPCASYDALNRDDPAGVRYGAYLRTYDVWWPSRALFDLLEKIPFPEEKIPADWSPDIRGIFEAVNRREVVARLKGGIRLSVSRSTAGEDGGLHPERKSAWLLSSDAWHMTEASHWGESSLKPRRDEWCEATERGMCRAQLLGTRRNPAAREVREFPTPFPGCFDDIAFDEVLGRGVPSLDRQDSQATITLLFLPSDEFTKVTINIDLVRSCITEMAWFSEGRELKKQCFSDFVMVHGQSWPATITSYENGKLAGRTTVTYGSLDPDGHKKAVKRFHGELSEAVFFTLPLPPPAEAAERLGQGRGSWEDHWSIIDYHGRHGTWEDMWAEFQKAEKLMQGKWALDWLRLRFLAGMSNQAALHRAELGLARRLAVSDWPERGYLAEKLLARQHLEIDDTDWAYTWCFEGQEEEAHDLALRRILAPVLTADEAPAPAPPAAGHVDLFVLRETITETIRRDGIDAAVAWVEETAGMQAHSPGVGETILAASAKRFLEHGHADAFLKFVEKWKLHLSEDSDEDLLACYLKACAWFGRKGETDALCGRWLSREKDASPRFKAALEYIFNPPGTSYMWTPGIERRWIRQLHERLHAELRDGHGLSLAKRLLDNQAFKRTWAASALRRDLYGTLERGIDSLAVPRLVDLFRLTGPYSPASGQSSRAELHRRLLERSHREEDPVARGLIEKLLLARGHLDVRLRLRRRQFKVAGSPAGKARLMGELCHLLFSSPWREGHQAELHGLIPKLGIGEDRLAVQVDAVHSLAWYVIKARAFDIMLAQDDRFSISLSEQADFLRQVRAEHRQAAVAALLAFEQSGIDPALVPFVRLERCTIQARGLLDVEKTADELLALFASIPTVPKDANLEARYRLLADRCLLALGYLAMRHPAKTGMNDRFLSLLEGQGGLKKSLVDARLHIFRFLLASGRMNDLTGYLEQWCRELPPALTDRWRRALAHLYAAEDRFAMAARVFSPMALRHGLSGEDYELLARWHRAAGEGDASRKAQARAHRQLTRYALEERIAGYIKALHRTGIMDFDGIRDALVALAAKPLRRPGDYFAFSYVVDDPIEPFADLFSATWDIRFLKLALALYPPGSRVARESSWTTDGENLFLGHLDEHVPDSVLAAARKLCADFIPETEQDPDSEYLEDVERSPMKTPAEQGVSEAELLDCLDKAETIGERLKRTEALAEFYTEALKANLGNPAEVYAKARRYSLDAVELVLQTNTGEKGYLSWPGLTVFYHAHKLGIPDVGKDLMKAAQRLFPIFHAKTWDFAYNWNSRRFLFIAEKMLAYKDLLLMMAQAAQMASPGGGMAFRSVLRSYIDRERLGMPRMVRNDPAVLAFFLDMALDEARGRLAHGDVRIDWPRNNYNGRRSYPWLTFFWDQHKADVRRGVLQVLESHPDDPDLACEVARFLALALERTEEAVAILLSFEEKSDLDIRGRVFLAEWLMGLDRLDEAYQYIEAWIREAPDERSLHFLLIKASGRLNRTVRGREAAHAAARCLMRTGGWNAESAGKLANICLGSGLSEVAAVYAAQALFLLQRLDAHSSDDEVLDVYKLLMNCHIKVGNLQKAAEVACDGIEALQDNPDDCDDLREILESLLYKSDELEDFASLCHVKYVAAGRENLFIRKVLVWVLLNLDRIEAARPHMEALKQAGLYDAELHDCLIQAYLRTGNREAAGKLVLLPPHRNVRDLDFYKKQGDVHALADEHGQAERAYTTMVEFSARESEGHERLARIREGQERYEDALQHWRRVREIRPREPGGILGEANCLILLKQTGEARTLLEKIVSRPWHPRFEDTVYDARNLLDDLKE